MLLDYRICTETFGNGVLIFGTLVTTVRLMMGVHGSLAEIIRSGCFAVVRGITIPGTAAVRIAAEMGWTVGAGAAAFGL
jgi:hypothetical protein